MNGNGPKSGGGMDVSDEEQHSQEETSALKGKEPKTSTTGKAVLSGPNKNKRRSLKECKTWSQNEANKQESTT